MSARLRMVRRLVAEWRAMNAANQGLQVEGLIDDLPLADDDAATWPTSAIRAAATPAGPPAARMSPAPTRRAVGR
jgi:hypothetical protein